MRPRSTDRILLSLLLLVAVVVAIVAGLALPAQRTGGIRAQPSTFFNVPYGGKAAYLALQHMGYDVVRLRRPIDTDTLAPLNALVVLRPVHALTRHEEEVLLGWVRAGHRLLVAPAEALPDTDFPPVDERQPLVAWFRFRPAPGPDAVSIVRTWFDSEEELLDGIQQLGTRSGPRFDDPPVTGPLADAGFRTIWADEHGVVATRIELGRGEIVALADVYALTNAGLRESDSPLWLEEKRLEDQLEKAGAEPGPLGGAR